VRAFGSDLHTVLLAASAEAPTARQTAMPALRHEGAGPAARHTAPIERMAIRYNAAPPEDERLIASINTTPLVDVMLVLLIIFLITIPVVNSGVAVHCRARWQPAVQAKPENRADFGRPRARCFGLTPRMPDPEALLDRLARVGHEPHSPRCTSGATARASYESVGRLVVFACQQMGIARVGFMAEPPGLWPTFEVKATNMAMNVGSAARMNPR
jgi:biopolymer transport protein ExbD